MSLSKRLQAIFDCVDKNSIPADIGCDHGLLAIELVKKGVCSKVYACDLREGPLSKAQDAIHQAMLDNEISTLLTNGMDHLPNEVDTIIIAGMGFETIRMILEAHEQELINYRKFIIQSNTDVDELRRWITQHDFDIVAEDIVEEGHFYQIVTFVPYGGKKLNEDEIMFGNLLSHPLFHKLWERKLSKLKEVHSLLPNQHAKKNLIAKQIKTIVNILHLEA